jgi:diguanylate cyclase
MLQQEQHIARIVTWIAALIALAIAVLLPGVVWFMSESSIAQDMELEAAMTAERLNSEIINRNPDMWRFEEHRLEELINKEHRPQESQYSHAKQEEQRLILDHRGAVLLRSGAEALPWPTLSRSAPLFASGNQTGSYRMQRTLRPALLRTLYASLLGIGLGLALFSTLRMLPLRALKSALSSLHDEKENLRIVVDNALDAILTTDADGRVESFNAAAEKMFALKLGDVQGQPIALLFPGMDVRSMAAGESLKPEGKGAEAVARRSDGSLFPIEFSCSQAMRGEVLKHILILRDISERKEAQETLTFLANYDSLTGLPNRNLFHERLAQAIARAERNEKLVALMFLDLDRFKTINDTLGHAKGDELLKAVSARLKGVLRRDDTVSRFGQDGDSEEALLSRLGGDEFTVILEGISHVNDAATAAQKIIDAMSQPFGLGGHLVYTSASIGITIFPFDDHDIGGMIKNADRAMYRSKETGRNNFHFYTEDMNVSTHERLTMEFHLRQALALDQFQLHYQPKAELGSGKVVGVEALIRWQHPELGLVSPLNFIPILEETGLILDVGNWVLRTACQQLRAWQDAGLAPLTLAINLSARQFKQADLAEQIGSALHIADLSPTLLEVEITESLLMEHTLGSAAILADLNRRGIGIAIDDFGTGYSSLAYLKHFPLTTLKIDRSFVQDVTTSPHDAAIASAVVALAHGLNLTVVAEGVETEAQRQFLQNLGCQQMQGYLLARPLPPAEFAAWLKTCSIVKATA